MRRLILLLLVPILLAAAPQPSGTLTLTSTSPVTFTATTDHVGRRDHVWVSMHCWDAANNLTYYGEEIERNGSYVMDDTVWVLWTPPGSTPQSGDSCRAFLLFRDEANPGEVVLDDSGFFTVP